MCYNTKCTAYLVLLLITAILLSGCVERFTGEDTELSTGDVLTPEMIESIFNEISASVTEKYPSETLEDGSLVVYWLDGGSVWHASLYCASITKASPENVRSGVVSDALSSGKERGCKICAANADPGIETITETAALLETAVDISQDKYPKEYDPNGQLIVYWVKNGSVWHSSRNCSSLLKSSDEDIFSGLEADANESGKSRGCKICNNE